MIFCPCLYFKVAKACPGVSTCKAGFCGRKVGDMDDSGIIDVLKNCDLFCRLEEKELAHLSGICGLKKFSPGERVFSQGDLSTTLHVIARGYVRLERAVNMGARKASVTVDLLGPGRAFGCWQSLLGESHALLCSATCTKTAVLLSVPGLPLREMMVGDKDLGFRVLECLCGVLRSRLSGVYGAMEKL